MRRIVKNKIFLFFLVILLTTAIFGLQQCLISRQVKTVIRCMAWLLIFLCLFFCQPNQQQKLFYKLTVKLNQQRERGFRGGFIFRVNPNNFFCQYGILVPAIFLADRSAGPFFFSTRAVLVTDSTIQLEGFDPGSERTLAAWLRHASRTNYSIEQSREQLVAKG